MATRPFRRPESHNQEHVTRDMLPDFLRSRGFGDITDERKRYGGGTVSQTIRATSPEGQSITMRVRLGWYRDRVSGGRSYSGVQLLSSVKDNDWEGSLNKKIRRDQVKGVTHFLFVQRESQQIKFAALVPISELLSIWSAQRDISIQMIREGKLGRARKNHAMNGSSPTIYLQDDRAPEVASALWEHQGVRDLARETPWTRLADHDADRTPFPDDNYEPHEGDFRDLIERQIRERRGQERFRNELRDRFGNRCVVTGSTVLAVLEAAHISPYRGEQDHHPENGLLLRSDIHTLFDLDLLGINPKTLVVELHPSLTSEYGSVAGNPIGCSIENKPSQQALKLRYEKFRRNLRSGEST